MRLILENEKAIGFIKSRKSDLRVMDMSAQMYQFAHRNKLKLMDVIVDQKADLDVDRPVINALMDVIETGKCSLILIRSINDITDDIDEQKHFLDQVHYVGGKLISIYEGVIDCNYDAC